jgi:hypothetical protein
MRVLFYFDTEWAFGMIHRELAKHLAKAGHDCDLYDWARNTTAAELSDICGNYDCIVTLLGIERSLTSVGVPKGKIIVSAHAKCDIDAFLKYDTSVNGFRSYFVVSPFLNRYSVEKGLGSATELTIGISCDRYSKHTPATLETLGYGSVMVRNNAQGVEIKRGWVAIEVAMGLGLKLKVAQRCSYLAMPAFWNTVDCCLVTSLEEGAGMTMLEAAASGRLVITTPVGHAPMLANLGAVICTKALANDTEVLTEMTELLQAYQKHSIDFYARGLRARDAVRCLDWKYVAPRWIELITA